VSLAIFNAGTDVLSGDALGGLELSLADVLQRDQFVLQALRARRIPTVVVTSGGYSTWSYLAIANTIVAECSHSAAQDA
jgi:histone deacetylase 11